KKHIHVTELLLSAYSKLKDTAFVPEIVHDLQSLSTDNLEAVAVLAKQLAREGKPDEAIDRLTRAIDPAVGPQKDHLQLCLAEVCYRSGKFAEAAAAYEAVVGATEDTPIVRKLLISHFNAGNHRRALDLAQALRGGGHA